MVRQAQCCKVSTVPGTQYEVRTRQVQIFALVEQLAHPALAGDVHFMAAVFLTWGFYCGLFQQSRCQSPCLGKMPFFAIADNVDYHIAVGVYYSEREGDVSEECVSQLRVVQGTADQSIRRNGVLCFRIKQK